MAATPTSSPQIISYPVLEESPYTQPASSLSKGSSFEGESPYSQPASTSSWQLPAIFLWFSSKKGPEPRIKWGRGDYPTQKKFTKIANLYWGPRKIYISPRKPREEALALLSEVEAVHQAYTKTLATITAAFDREVTTLPLAERVKEYDLAIQEVATLFDLPPKRNQIIRDLKGHFINIIIKNEGQDADETTKTLLIQEILLPFAETGDKQFPFAPVDLPPSGILSVTSVREKPNYHYIPDYETEKAKVEDQIRIKFKQLAPPLTQL